MYIHRCKQLITKCTFSSVVTKTFPKFSFGGGAGQNSDGNDT